MHISMVSTQNVKHVKGTLNLKKLRLGAAFKIGKKKEKENKTFSVK